MTLTVLVIAGCMVGPDYRRPPAPTADGWLASGDARLRTDRVDTAGWWRTFDDPALETLVGLASRQSLTLQAAGLRVIQAQARRGIAIGGLFPQQQGVAGSYTRSRASLNQRGLLGARDADSFLLRFDAAWELDMWGRFRRGIEAADAALLAAVADYDDVLVSLVGEVAGTYVQIREFDERIALARDNVRVQSEALDIARVRYEAGGTSELDVQQAATLLADTEATIPALEIQRRQSLDTLCVLLGLPPTDLAPILDTAWGIPVAPPSVAVGIPADLLHRRPDVRRAERLLAAQSARIGVALTDLLPSVQLVGTVGLSAEQAVKLFEGRSFEGIGGPRFDWPILNYGRLINAVRVEDATFQELAARYADTVVRAQQEVEDALVGYLLGADEVGALVRSVEGANRAVELAIIQYREGAADFTRVLTAQQAKLQEDDRLATARGARTLSVVALYKALGGGWELREGEDFVPDTTKAEMRERTWWGSMLAEEARAGDVQQAATGTEGDRTIGPLRWRRWWPRW